MSEYYGKECCDGLMMPAMVLKRMIGSILVCFKKDYFKSVVTETQFKLN